MRDNSDNTQRREKFFGPSLSRRLRMRRKQGRQKRQLGKEDGAVSMASALPAPFDPDLLYVECEKCGSPVIWGEGRAARVLAEAGIDPLELDSFCILLTDGCPVCGLREEYSVRILRSGIRPELMPVHGHA